MPPLSSRDQRTIRIAAVIIAVYLSLFFGFRGWKQLEARRSEYQRLVLEARNLSDEIRPYENKVLLLEKLMHKHRFDLAKLSSATLVGETSAAIQRAAQSSGIQLGPIRESPGSASSRELAGLQLEATGQAAAVMILVHQLENLGYPLIVESVQINPEPRPGMVKLHLNVVVPNVEHWKSQEARRHG